MIIVPLGFFKEKQQAAFSPVPAAINKLDV